MDSPSSSLALPSRHRSMASTTRSVFVMLCVLVLSFFVWMPAVLDQIEQPLLAAARSAVDLTTPGEGWVASDGSSSHDGEPDRLRGAGPDGLLLRGGRAREGDDDIVDETVGSPVHFVLYIGLEGTGHHLWSSVMDKSPLKQRLRVLGLRPAVFQTLLYDQQSPCRTGLWSPNACPHQAMAVKASSLLLQKQSRLASYNSQLRLGQSAQRQTSLLGSKPGPDTAAIQARLAEEMRWQAQRAQNPARASDKAATVDDPLYVPLNVFSQLVSAGMMSYPNFAGNNRALQRPYVDILFEACRMANVTCDMVYIYRDPYAVLSSTLRSGYNRNAIEALQLYVSMLGIIHYELYSHRRVAGCWDFDHVLGEDATQSQSESIRSLLGWKDDATAYRETLSSVYKSKPPLNDTQKAKLVPPEYQPYMDSMIRAHRRVIDLCEQLNSFER